ncbi:hypothetical protein [Tengunoibacter tsumagoiensis]|uniref:ATP synthase subunit c n=1 Tax=Tengunoibacter tsumagoiensis TaxID=2014871 RepID=A0A402A4H2_9CHLR|nr:hypothetical protein [Tengunoibacter tsumagoiensis]GCE13956.1 hypothetical protein KTT_38150 [Tengunoibacter tsumagoiensis]
MPTQALAVALAIGLGAIGAGIAIAFTTSQAYVAIGRNPSAEPAIRTNFILGLVFAETLAIYSLLIAALLLFHTF